MTEIPSSESPRFPRGLIIFRGELFMFMLFFREATPSTMSWPGHNSGCFEAEVREEPAEPLPKRRRETEAEADAQRS